MTRMQVGKRAGRITKMGTKDKVAVMGILERGGKVCMAVIQNRRKAALQVEVRKHVEAGSALYTDAVPPMRGLLATKLIRLWTMQWDTSAVKSTRTAWSTSLSLLKRDISGTYISVEPSHLFRCLDEQTFRYNHREGFRDGDRFDAAVRKIVGKRLAFDQLTGKDEPGVFLN